MPDPRVHSVREKPLASVHHRRVDATGVEAARLENPLLGDSIQEPILIVAFERTIGDLDVGRGAMIVVGEMEARKKPAFTSPRFLGKRQGEI